MSQIAMRRHELEARAGRGEPGPTPPDPRVAGFADASALAPAGRAPGQPDAGPKPAEGGSDGADVGTAAPLKQLLVDDVRALARKLDDMRRERAEERASAIDLSAMRAEIDAMRRSLADLAPRNAVVALEGAIRDLVQRVEMLRQSGHGESMLAPLEAMAAEFRAAVKAHDPQAAAAGLEREIRAIGGQDRQPRGDGDRSRNVRAHPAADRGSAQSPRLGGACARRRSNGWSARSANSADRVERLGASPAPQFESTEMAALWPRPAGRSNARRPRRRSPRSSSASSRSRRGSIRRLPARPLRRRSIRARSTTWRAASTASANRLEARPPATIDIGPIEKLLREFDAKLDAAGGADADAKALESIFVDIRDKLDRLADPEAGARQLEPVLHELGARLDAVASPVDLNPIETMLRSLEAKFEASAAAPVDREVVEQVADEVARRLRDLSARQADLEAVTQQIDTIYDRIDALAAKASGQRSRTGRARAPRKIARGREGGRRFGARDLGRGPRRARRAFVRAEGRTGERGPAHAIAPRRSARAFSRL